MVLEFGLGVGVAYIIKRGVTALWPLCLVVSFGLFAFAASRTWGLDWVFGMPRVATFGLGSALAIYAVAAAELRGATFPQWLQYLGAMSYSLYVWHMLILMWMATTADNYFVSRLPGPIQLAVWLGVALTGGAVSYEFIERPILQRMKHANSPGLKIAAATQ
jgi:exopolysaccharide production protein ExoZ